MIIGPLDLGASHPWAAPIIGQEVGSYLIEGLEYAVWPRGSILRRQTVSFRVKAWQALGGGAANSSTAQKYLLKQVEELASNRDQQPVYIQWTATADPGALLNTSELHDGWYVTDDFSPDYSQNVVTGPVQCTMTVTQVSAAPPRRHAMSYQGGALSTNFSGTATNLVSLPVGATATETNFTRTAAEGSIPCVLSPLASPEPFVPSATIANWYKGGVHVYDTINTSNNPVPTSGGTFVNANWVEVFYTDHDFQGDCVVTNGLQLLLFQNGTNQIATCYLWNTALATANWQQYALLLNYDNSLSSGFSRGYTLNRIGQEECAITVINSNSTPNSSIVNLRLQRGRYDVRADLGSLTQILANSEGLALTVPAASTKIDYNSTTLIDAVLDGFTVAPATDYGYGAAFIANSTYPFIVGTLYQNQPGNSQPYATGANVGLGDSTAIAVNAIRSYGFFAIPYGVNGSYDVTNLQAEAESGTLQTGWTSIVDAAASNGHTANLASGTGSTQADLWGTAFVPDPGAYDLWVRMKTTTATSGTAQLKIGLWDATSGAFVSSTTYAPNQTTTGYVWYKVCSAVTPTATHNMQPRAVTTATTTDAWQIDESALVPRTLTTDHRGPQELWQQFGFDRSTKVIQL